MSSSKLTFGSDVGKWQADVSVARYNKPYRPIVHGELEFPRQRLLRLASGERLSKERIVRYTRRSFVHDLPPNVTSTLSLRCNSDRKVFAHSNNWDKINGYIDQFEREAPTFDNCSKTVLSNVRCRFPPFDDYTFPHSQLRSQYDIINYDQRANIYSRYGTIPETSLRAPSVRKTNSVKITAIRNLA